MSHRTSRSRGDVIRTSPSRRKVSSIEKKDDDELTVNPTEIDELITNWYEVKNKIKELEEKEQRYKKLIHKLLDVTGSDAIKGKELMVKLSIQKRRFISKNLVPESIFNQYAKTQEIKFLTIKEI